MQIDGIQIQLQNDNISAHTSRICIISTIHAISLHHQPLLTGVQMLLRFGVANHLSISGRQELTYAASSLKDRDDGLITSQFVPTGAVLPAALIYGANASGKSNLLKALLTMRRMVSESHASGDPGGGVGQNAFRLDPKCAKEPTCFDIDFVVEGIRYHYGFEATDEAFTAEWLYQTPKSHSRLMFDRRDDQFRFGRSLTGSNNTIAKLTRHNSLFLSAAAQNDHSQLSAIYHFFRSIDFDMATSVSGWNVMQRNWENGVDERIVKFLKLVNTGVVGHRMREAPRDGADNIFTAIGSALMEISELVEIRENPDAPIDYAKWNSALELAHRGHKQQSVYFDLNMESAGTRRLLIVLDRAFRALDLGSVLCVDELDASLHTHVGEAILELFCSRETNPNGAQLIVTTHDTNLLTCASIRRDQVWFVEKSPAGASEVYPLTDIQTRKGDNIELGYLQGRYGAVPPDPELSQLVESS